MLFRSGPVAAGGAADPELDAPGLDLLLEQPASAATTIAAPATPAVMPCFTSASFVSLVSLSCLVRGGNTRRIVCTASSPTHVRDRPGAADTQRRGLQTCIPGRTRISTRGQDCCSVGSMRERR